MMTTNTSFENIGVFSWDIDNSMWSSFNSPYAHSIYKWAVIICLCNFLQVLIVPAITWALVFFSQTINIWILKLQLIFNKGYTKVGIEAEKDRIVKWGNFMSWLWHGYEIVGCENIPDGPAIIYVYHGTFAIDMIHAHYRLLSASKKRPIGYISNRSYKNANGQALQAVNHCTPNREEIYALLKEGWQFVLTIGGERECKLSDNNYRVYNPKRYGLCHVLKEFKDKKIPVVPLFTRNIQEAFWIPWFIKPLVKTLPKRYRRYLHFTGGLPVKLKSFIGKEIEYDVSMPVEEILDKLCSGMQAHIDQHQIVPGNRMRALRERFCASRINSIPV